MGHDVAVEVRPGWVLTMLGHETSTHTLTAMVSAAMIPLSTHTLVYQFLLLVSSRCVGALPQLR
jgi:hypothetical protein